MENGAPIRIRTRDPLITNQVLYQLSYKGRLASFSNCDGAVQDAFVRAGFNLNQIDRNPRWLQPRSLAMT